MEVGFGKKQIGSAVQDGALPGNTVHFWLQSADLSPCFYCVFFLGGWEDRHTVKNWCSPHTFFSLPRSNSFHQPRQEEKAGKTHRCQRVGGWGQRSRVGDLGIQQTCPPFTPPHLLSIMDWLDNACFSFLTVTFGGFMAGQGFSGITLVIVWLFSVYHPEISQ